MVSLRRKAGISLILLPTAVRYDILRKETTSRKRATGAGIKYIVREEKV